MHKLYLDNDNVIELSGVTNKLTGAVVNTATVNVTLLDSNGDPVAGQAWPVSMAYVPNTAGTYRGLLSRSLSLEVRELVTAKVEATAAEGYGQWETPVSVIRRG